MTNAEARFNNSLRQRKPEGSFGRTAQDGHDSHTAPELCLIQQNETSQKARARRLATRVSRSTRRVVGGKGGKGATTSTSGVVVEHDRFIGGAINRARASRAAGT